MMQEEADRAVTWQSQWHVKTSMAGMKHPRGVEVVQGRRRGASQVRQREQGEGGGEVASRVAA